MSLGQKFTGGPCLHYIDCRSATDCSTHRHTFSKTNVAFGGFALLWFVAHTPCSVKTNVAYGSFALKPPFPHPPNTHTHTHTLCSLKIRVALATSLDFASSSCAQTHRRYGPNFGEFLENIDSVTCSTVFLVIGQPLFLITLSKSLSYFWINQM